jgi:short-chain fatty acids transporter
MQMSMILIGGYALASSPPVDRALTSIARRLTSSRQAVVATSLLGLTGCLFNWGFGLVVAAIFCRKVAVVMPNVNFRLMVATAYSGFMVWHGGFSGSVPLLMATPGNFTEKLIGRIVSIEESLFTWFNLTAVIGVYLAILTCNYVLGGSKRYQPVKVPQDPPYDDSPEHSTTPAAKLERSRLITYATFGMSFLFVYSKIAQGRFTFDLNHVNFMFLIFAFFLHQKPIRFAQAVYDGTKKVGPILLQFPFYAGIMGVMRESGLATLISNYFVEISTANSFAFLTFISASILNLFVPSGGGQWAIQAPIVIPAAHELGADLIKTSMAIAWGDAWTNMLQPFWALPVLAVAGLHLRDIMSYCLIYLIASGVVLMSVFLIF